MLTDYLKDPSVVERLRTGPAGTHIDDFTDWLAAGGHKYNTARGLIRGLDRFATWATQNDLALADVDENVVRRFLDHLVATGRRWHHCGKQTEEVTASRRFIRYLDERGELAPPVSPASEPALLGEFREWMITRRGVRESTLAGYGRVIADLLENLGEETESYQADALRGFVLNRAAQHGISKAKIIVTSVRMFLRFLAATGRCRTGLDGAIPVIADWKLSAQPRHLPATEVERLIASCDDRTSTALRDKAIILLASRLGLRAGDIAGLTFDDVDWTEARLRVSGKNRREVWLPLPQEVGDAILAYLEHERPGVPEAHVFITALAPYVPAASYLISSVVRRAMERAGIDAPSRGAHILRHSAATAMLRQGATLHEISSVLRHASIETTYHYAKVDADLLRMVAAPWPTLPETPVPEAHATDADIRAMAQSWPEEVSSC